jgi:DNA modification methylase
MNQIIFGDCIEVMNKLISDGIKVQTCITSPPYFGLRDYGVEGQIGLEETPEAYVDKMVEVFRCVRDLLADDGTLWLNLGDSYFPHNGSRGNKTPAGDTLRGRTNEYQPAPKLRAEGIKGKDLIGIPWLVALALRADGWYLRQDIIWAKPNPMPESVTDRCTKSHEYIFLMSKNPQYYFDNEAIKEPSKSQSQGIRFGGNKYGDSDDPKHATKSGNVSKEYPMANKRSVWTQAVKPYKGAHFATFPPQLIEPCVLAGSRINDIVFDPFMGSGTTAEVAIKNGREYLGCELNPEYEKLQKERINNALADLVIKNALGVNLFE